ncbi:MAG: polyprenol monophosphomannose synthase [Candidatus Eisenbacteria bacterium]|uniref:Polyprenol monophosphomannose synthase n=1 Tax=Eiseniibacteriota bacterium TaxID=2212470 RepID=A0A956M1G2_UNCEI|nr:polyprenol monophosphomannose synthase [Candidatus Eisenbacteria bacterium]
MALRCMVVIPTYNEVDNVQTLLPRILQLSNFQVLVVDDNSPDGTARAVRQMAAQNPRIHLLERPGKLGLGSAYIAGFRYALEQGVDVIFEMDADFSHDPAALPSFVEAIDDADLVLGSRYLHGVTVVNWPLKRLILSYSANVYAGILTGLPVKDATGGFKAFRREVLEAIDLDRIRSDGYSFQVEMTFHCWRKGFVIKEIPIVFADRRVGISKMNRKIIFEATWMVWRLFLLRVFTRERRVGPVERSVGETGEEGSAEADPEWSAPRKVGRAGQDVRSGA